uniref:Uncharacterized protein n=1 Tax=Rhizophora mucronata TaxID=61149 RepID=A0A2P2QEY0_RHIMU
MLVRGRVKKLSVQLYCRMQKWEDKYEKEDLRENTALSIPRFVTVFQKVIACMSL